MWRNSMKNKFDYQELANKFTLSIDESCAYFRIGEKRLRALMDAQPDAEWLLRVGNRRYILRPEFQNFLRTVKQL